MSDESNRVDDAVLDEIDETMMRIGRVMSQRHVGEDCCPDRLTMSQAMLARALHLHGPSRVSDVAAIMGVKPPAASAAIDSLEREGYVVREPDPEDRRVTMVSLTDLGREVLAGVEAKRREAMARMLSVLSAEDVGHLVRIHRQLLEAMEAGRV